MTVTEPQPAFTDTAAGIIRWTVTVVAAVIATLTFCFGFGNVWHLALQLGVPGWVAPLVAPAVDLSVAGLLVALQYLRAKGVRTRLLGPRGLLLFCGVATLALNTAEPMLAGAYGRAMFDAICPLLLLGWSDVGPRLIAALHKTVPDGLAAEKSAPDETVPSIALVAAARELAAMHQAEHGRRITRDELRAGMSVSNEMAGKLLRLVRSPPRQP
ncbi:hypothetical protein [Fodinicola acaciae]|uniref:hypothetical protein n=1 Tax=Fodinicola acaciae TaxID=2681555 RepID=UPI001C9E82F7|nr:hypothetical protein [Fodinicola acaciae]